MAETYAPTNRVAALIAVAGVAGFVGYAMLSYWLMIHAAREPWTIALLFGPLMLAVAVTAWKRAQFAVLAACAVGAAILILVAVRGGVDDTNRMYVLQHAGFHLALAWTFGSTLRPGATPLISAMASTVHEVFTPEMRAYTRWLTGAWTVFFLGMIVVSLLIYGLAPWTWWSLFGNVLTPAAAISFFVIEHVLRYQRHPDFERVTLRGALGAYRRIGKSRGDAGNAGR